MTDSKELLRFSKNLAINNGKLADSNVFLLQQNMWQRVVIFFMILLEIFSTIVKFLTY